jgi:phosphohistidine phosphatase
MLRTGGKQLLVTKLYLIRHGIAADKGTYASDSERPLTDKGRRETEKVAKRLQQLGLRFDLILTSPLVRSRQTAEILTAAKLSERIEASDYLAPNGDIYSWLRWLEGRTDNSGRCLALVGHQPNLSHWAEILVWGDAKEALVLKKAGVIGLSLPETGTPVGKSQMFLLTAPKWLL